MTWTTVRVSFLKGYLDSYRWPDLLDRHPEIKNAAIRDPAAFQDGVELRQAMEFVYTADLADYRAGINHYDQVVIRLNLRYGTDFAVESRGNRDLGLRGFRIAAFGKVTDMVHHVDGTTSATITARASGCIAPRSG